MNFIFPVHSRIIGNPISKVNRFTDGVRYQNTDMKTFGERLKSARKRSKLTQTEAAKKVGMSQSLLSELENNEYPTSGFTIQLAALYRVNPLWLADGLGLPDLSENEKIIDIGRKYLDLNHTDQLLIQLILNPTQTPAWLSPAVHSAIETARQLISEQLPKNN